MTRSILADAFDHHVWATQKVLEVCSTLTPEQLAATAPGTYGTIIDTLRHIVGADSSYLFAITGGRTEQIDEETIDIPGMRTAMERYGRDYAAFLAQDLDPDANVIRYRDDGSESQAPLGVRLAQVVHHGTDHRSQICTILTTLGVQTPEIDVWDMAGEQGRLTIVEPAQA